MTLQRKTPQRYVSFNVDGTPVAQGSMVSPRAGVVLHSKSARLKSWRAAIGWAAQQAMHGPPWTGPVKLELYFVYRPRRKADSERPKDTAPDLDKLIRAVLDACTGVIYLDDRQVGCIEAKKYYGQYAPASEGGSVETSLGVSAYIWDGGL